jgi:hypothetical protein
MSEANGGTRLTLKKHGCSDFASTDFDSLVNKAAALQVE